MLGKVLTVLRRYLPPFLSYRENSADGGGGQNLPPSSGARDKVRKYNYLRKTHSWKRVAEMTSPTRANTDYAQGSCKFRVGSVQYRTRKIRIASGLVIAVTWQTICNPQRIKVGVGTGHLAKARHIVGPETAHVSDPNSEKDTGDTPLIGVSCYCDCLSS